MPGMSTLPPGQNVATMSSVRPSSSASVYAAMAARTPSATSAKVSAPIRTSPSEGQVLHRLLEGIDVHRVHRGQELLVGQPGEEAVDRALEVRDVALELAREAHVLEPVLVQALLLSRDVREVLRR